MRTIYSWTSYTGRPVYKTEKSWFRIPNVSYTERFVYRTFRIPNVSYTERFIYRTFRILNVSYTKHFVYRTFRIPNVSYTITFRIPNVSYTERFVHRNIVYRIKCPLYEVKCSSYTGQGFVRCTGFGV